MTDSILWSEGFFSPRTELAEMYPYNSIFMCRPRSTEGMGWGEPFQYIRQGEDDPEIPPNGTLDGDNQVKVLLKSSGNWAKSNRPGNQEYGNIDWRGPIEKVTSDGVTVRHNLTWNGPQMRYFADPDFDYTDERNTELYYRGKILLVTPFPILGAALKNSNPRPITGPIPDDFVLGDWYVIVICKDGYDDVVYKYRMDEKGGYSRENIEADNGLIRGHFLEVYDEEDNPLGFVLQYRAERHTELNEDPEHYVNEAADPADTPWFFNESCTQAVCMRKMFTKYKVLVTTDGLDHYYEEYSQSKFKMTIAALTASPVNRTYLGNLRNLEWLQKHYFSINHYSDGSFSEDEPLHFDNYGLVHKYAYVLRPPVFIEEGHADNDVLCTGDTEMSWHNYRLFALRQSWQIAGSKIVAADFDGDELITAKIDVDNFRSNNQEFTHGVDCNDYDWSVAGHGKIDYFCTAWDEDSGAPYTACGELCDPNAACANVLDRSFTHVDSNITYLDPITGEPAYNIDTNGIKFLDGYPAPWTGGRISHILSFNNSSGHHELDVHWDLYGTVHQVDNRGEENPDDLPFLRKHGGRLRFPHFLDLRHPFMCVFTEIFTEEWIDDTESSWASVRNSIDKRKVTTQIFQREGYCLDANDTTVLTEKIILNTVFDGDTWGYDRWGNKGYAKPVIGGPDWKDLSETDLYFIYNTGEGGDPPNTDIVPSVVTINGNPIPFGLEGTAKNTQQTISKYIFADHYAGEPEPYWENCLYNCGVGEPTGYYNKVGARHEYRTECINGGVLMGFEPEEGQTLEEANLHQSLDNGDLEPKFEDFYSGNMEQNDWEQWPTHFQNDYYHYKFDKQVSLNKVEGAFAKIEGDWIFSYKVPRSIDLEDDEDEEVVWLNYLNGKPVGDTLTDLADHIVTTTNEAGETTKTSADDIVKTLNPIGVY